jgi:hypothetical protein
MEDHSNLKANIINEQGDVVKSYTPPRGFVAILAIQSGMSDKEVSTLLDKPEEELQALVNRIGQEFIVL